MGSYPQKPGLIALIVTTCVVFVVVLAMNGLAAGGGGGIFLNNTGDISNKYYTTVTPAGWTFIIWGFIYTWQVLFLVYGVSTIFRQGVDGYLYYSPMIMPYSIYIIYIFSSVVNVIWLILWDREEMIAALPIIALIPFSLYCCTAVSCIAVHKCQPVLNKHNLMKEAWLIRFLVQNALAFYATWVTIATILNFSVVLVYFADVSQDTTGTVCTCIVAAEITIWIILDTFVLDQYARYIFSPYIVVIVALAGIIDANYVSGELNSILTVILEAVACAAFVLKLVLMLWRHFKRPLESVAITPTTESEKNLHLEDSC